MRLYTVFTKIIYLIALVDVAVISITFWNLSRSGEEELKDAGLIDFGIWEDYTVWLFFVGLSVFLHKSRESFLIECTEHFRVQNRLLAETITKVFCDLLPAVVLVALFIRFTV